MVFCDQESTRARQQVWAKEEGRGAQGCALNDGEDEKEEPVKKHARHEEGHMPGSSSTDPVPMQEQSPAPTERGQGQALAAGRRRDMDEDWEELTFKMRRSGGSGQRERDGQDEEDVPMIMDLM